MAFIGNQMYLQINQVLMEREELLLHFCITGAFINELMQMEQPSTGKWWIQ